MPVTGPPPPPLHTQIITGEHKATKGTTYRHPNLRMAYVAQVGGEGYLILCAAPGKGGVSFLVCDAREGGGLRWGCDVLSGLRRCWGGGSHGLGLTPLNICEASMSSL